MNRPFLAIAVLLMATCLTSGVHSASRLSSKGLILERSKRQAPTEPTQPTTEGTGYSESEGETSEATNGVVNADTDNTDVSEGERKGESEEEENEEEEEDIEEEEEEEVEKVLQQELEEAEEEGEDIDEGDEDEGVDKNNGIIEENGEEGNGEEGDNENGGEEEEGEGKEEEEEEEEYAKELEQAIEEELLGMEEAEGVVEEGGDAAMPMYGSGEQNQTGEEPMYNYGAESNETYTEQSTYETGSTQTVDEPTNTEGVETAEATQPTYTTEGVDSSYYNDTTQPPQAVPNINTAPPSTGYPETTTSEGTSPGEGSPADGSATPTEGSSPTVDLDICSFTMKLDSICELSEETSEYFGEDLSMGNVINSLFSPSILEVLEDYGCKAGNWCLPAGYYEMFKDDDPGFHDGQFCTNEVKQCVNTVLQAQNDVCPGTDQVRLWGFLNGTLDLLCMPDLSREEDSYCFASAVELLFVLYKDVDEGNVILSKHQDELNMDDCNDYSKQITNMYLCAKENCTMYEQEEIEKFTDQEMESLSQRAAKIREMCSFEMTCDVQKIQEYEAEEADLEYDQGEDYDDDYYNEGNSTITPEEEKEYLDEEEQVLQDAMNAVEEEEEELENTMSGGESSAGLLYGMISLAVVILLGFIAVAYVKYRRGNVDKFYLYNRGYSKLDQDEETRMLANALN